MHENAQGGNKAANLLGISLLLCCITAVITVFLIIIIRTAVCTGIELVTEDLLTNGEPDPADTEIIADIAAQKDIISLLAAMIVGVIIFLPSAIRTAATAVSCVKAITAFNQRNDLTQVTDCAYRIRSKYIPTVVMLIVIIISTLSVLSDAKTSGTPYLAAANMALAVFMLPAALHVITASAVLKTCGIGRKPIFTQIRHNDGCSENEHHYDIVNGEAKDCYSSHKYDSYSEKESYSDDYDYFADDDRFTIDQSRYDYTGTFGSSADTDTDRDDD